MQSLPDFGGWCAFCEERPSIGRNADGQPACLECAKRIIEERAFELEQIQAEARGMNRQQRRAARRAALRRNDGSPKA